MHLKSQPPTPNKAGQTGRLLLFAGLALFTSDSLLITYAIAQTVTLPEITIVGDPNSPRINAADWWAGGFIDGYNNPGEKHELPALVVNDQMAASYFIGILNGIAAAQKANEEVEKATANSPGVEPDIKGISLEESQREFNESFEALFHTHMPHVEIEMDTTDLSVPPGIGLVE